MSLASSSVERADVPVFADGLGERMVVADATTGELLQMLRLRPALTSIPSFEFAVRERTARLMNFRHAYYARVRRVDRMQASGTLALISDHIEGTRLSDILKVAHGRAVPLDTNAALCLIRQLVPAVALLHENARDASHGVIAPERLIVTPHARLVIVEHVLGSAIEQLQFGRERLWQEFRVAVPASAGIARFDHRADVTGIGITALALVLGRPIGAEEFPHAVPALLMQARERFGPGEERPLSPALRHWLARTLQLDVRRAFASAPEALVALEETLAGDTAYLPASIALEAFLSQFAAAAMTAAPAQTPALPTAVPAMTPVAPPPGAALQGALPPVAPFPQVQNQYPQRPEPAGADAIGGDIALPEAQGPGFEPGDPLQSLPTIADLIAVDDLGLRRVDEPHRPAAPELRSEPAVLQFDDEPELQRPSHSEAAIPSPQTARGQTAPPAPRRRGRNAIVAAVCSLLVLAAAGVVGVGMYTAPAPVEALPGTLIVQSSPPGVEVFVDGVSRGMTPASISVPAGSHILELRGRGVPRVIPLDVPAGGQVSQYLEFADTPVTGMLVVHSQPAGATVIVDGVPRGTAPLTLEGIEPGDREVVLQSERGSSRHTVTVLSGTTASLVAPVVADPGGPVSGWVSLAAPFTVEIREDGQLLGTSDTDRLMLAAGRHVLELANEPLGFRQTRTVQVQPGKVTPVPLELPRGMVNLNASPWAEVWVDGRRVGETPIGNLELPIGPHEIVFRHPQFGEKRHAISVTTSAPARLSVSMQ